MKPIIYETNETQFTSHGLGAVSPIECIVTEELNGIYELEMIVSESDKRYGELKVDRIILAQPYEDAVAQPFRIYRITQPMNGQVGVYAEHVSYQLNNIPVMPFTASGASATMAQFKTKSAETNPFTFTTDFTSTKQFKIDKPELLRNLMVGDYSLLSVFGYGEFEYDRFNVKFVKSRGEDRAVSIRYGKNMTDFQQETNIQNMVTGIFPYWKREAEDNLIKGKGTTRTVSGVAFKKNPDGSITASGTSTSDISYTIADIKLASGTYVLSGCPSGGSGSGYSLKIIEPTTYTDIGNGVQFSFSAEATAKVRIVIGSGTTVSNLTFTPTLALKAEMVTLDEKVVHPSNITDTYYRTIVVDFSNEFDEKPTQAELRQAAVDYMTLNGVGVPEVSITVAFAPLWQSENYKDIAPLEEVMLGDTVGVEFPKLNVSTTAKIVKTEFDVLKNRYKSVTVGKVRTDLSNTLTDSNKTISKTISNTSDSLKKDSKKKVEQISGKRGGFFRIQTDSNDQPNEVLYMSTGDIETARYVYKWDSSGLWYSSDGYTGTFSLILPMSNSYLQINGENVLLPSTLASDPTYSALSGAVGSLSWDVQDLDRRVTALERNT